MDKILFEAKVADLKFKAKKKAKAAINWAVDHKEFLAVATPLAIGGVKFIAHESNKVRHDIHERKMADEYYDRRIYDPSDGIKYTLKHAMSEKEKSEYGRLRHEEGLSVWEALKKMRLID